MGCGVRVFRAVEAPPDQKDFRPVWGDPVGGRGSTLGEFLRSWIPEQVDLDSLGLIGMDPDPKIRAVRRKSCEWLSILKQDRVDIVVCQRRERLWRQSLARQWRKVHAARVREREVEGPLPMSEYFVGARDIRDTDGYIIAYRPERSPVRHVELRPMKASKLASWTDCRVLLEATLAPNYDTRLQKL